MRAYRLRRLLAAADGGAILIAIGCCLALAALTRFETTFQGMALLAPLFVGTWVFLAGLGGMYHIDDRRIDCSAADELFRIVQLVALWTWVNFLFAAVIDQGVLTVAPAVGLAFFAIPALLLVRAVARSYARTRPWYQQKTVIVGTEADCKRVVRTLARHPEFGIHVAGTINPRVTEHADDASHTLPSSSVYALTTLVLAEGADRVILASSYEGMDERTGALRWLAEKGIKVDLVPGDSEVFRSDAELHHIEGLPLLTLPSTRRARSAETVKRALDVAAAGVTLVLLTPFFAAIALAIKLDSRGSVFFQQRRMGRGGQPFAVFKFRTMDADAEDQKLDLDELNTRTDGMFKIPADPRITRIGSFLRKYSLDELPQLLNVLRGDMSLVGPRPLIPAESNQVSDRYAARFDVRPGITGPWQVLGRSDIPFEDMVKLDYTYVTNWTLGDDAKLMMRTLSAISGGRGAY